MATAVGLNMKMTADTSGLGRGMTRAEKLLTGVDKNARSAARSLRVIATLQIGGALLKGLTSITRGLTSVARSAVNYAGSLASSIDETAKLAQRTGIAVEALQGFQVAAELSGVPNLDRAIQRLTITIGDAAAGVKEPQKAFERLGIDFEKLAGLKPEDQFRQVAAAFQDVGTQAEKAAIAADLFGRSGVELLPLFNSNLAEIEARAQRLGIVLGQEQTAAIERMNDALFLVRKTLDGILGQVLANIADVVTAIAEEFLQFVEAFEGFDGATGGNAIADLITKTLLEGLTGFLDVVRVLGDSFLRFADILGQIIAKIAPYVGIDVRSDSQRRLDQMEAAGGPPVGWRTAATIAEYEKTVSELRAQVAKERQGLDIGGIRQAFNQAVDVAQGVVGNAQQRFQNRVIRQEETAPTRPSLDLIEEVAAPVLEFAKNKATQIAAFGKGMFDGVVEGLMERQKQIEAISKEITAIEKQRAERASEIEESRLDALSKLSNQALTVSDIRSGGISEAIRIGTGREDPAIEEYRRQLAELQKIDAKLGALEAQKVRIIGGAGRAA